MHRSKTRSIFKRGNMANINRKVLDISHHNDVTSWDAIRNAGIVGIIHKATEGTGYTDDQYLKRCAPAMRAGLIWGAYHFANGSNVKAQVDHFLDVVGVDDETLYALDWEDDPNGNTMSASQAKEFLQRIGERIGMYRCIVYSGNTAKSLLGSKPDEFFGKHRLWLAQYASSGITVQASWDDCWLWQYSDGNVGPGPQGCPGCEGDVDTNSWGGKDDELRQQWTGTGIAPPTPGPGPEPDEEEKPTLGKGDEDADYEEPYVSELQTKLNQENGAGLHVDGDFGGLTDSAVRSYQASRGLDVDGLVGKQTWDALDTHLPPLPPPPGLPAPLAGEQQEQIARIAINSSIASYNFEDRGQPPSGYVKGFALSFANTYRQLLLGYPPAVEMAKAKTTDADHDVLSWYAGKYNELNMDNSKDGPQTLIHVWALMLGLGMRESSGAHCMGRDTSAGSSSMSSDTCEAGIYQTSYNAHNCSKNFDMLFDAFSAGKASDNPQGFLKYFEEDVECSEANWDNYGSGAGEQFQAMCKEQPAFACETCAIVLRRLRAHYGPINRYEAELKQASADMLKAVKEYIDQLAPVA